MCVEEICYICEGNLEKDNFLMLGFNDFCSLECANTYLRQGGFMKRVTSHKHPNIPKTNDDVK